MADDIQIEVVTEIDPHVSLRRFRWMLRASSSPDVASPQTFATKREATIDGQIALDRARQRGRVRA